MDESSSPAFARGGHTLSGLIAAGTEVIAACTSADLRKPADLVAMQTKLGADFSLFNYRCACPNDGCPGFVRFYVTKGMRREGLCDRDTDALWKREASERRTAWLAARR